MWDWRFSTTLGHCLLSHLKKYLWIQVVESVVEGQRYSIEALNFPSRAEVAFALSNGDDLKAPPQSLGTHTRSEALIHAYSLNFYCPGAACYIHILSHVVCVTEDVGVAQGGKLAWTAPAGLPNTVYFSVNSASRPKVIGHSTLLDVMPAQGH